MTDTVVDRVVNLYEAGLVQRYHTHPRFARFGQTNGHHQWSVAALLLALHPAPSAALLAEAIMHDVGERYAGDIPRPVKFCNPTLAADHAELERTMRVDRFERAGPRALSEEDHRWIKAVDAMECIMYASVTVPHALKAGPWQGLVAFVEAEEQQLSPAPRVSLADVMAFATARQGFIEQPSA